MILHLPSQLENVLHRRGQESLSLLPGAEGHVASQGLRGYSESTPEVSR